MLLEGLIGRNIPLSTQKIVFYSLITVLGQTIENVSIIFWLNSFPDNFTPTYAVLLQTAISYFLVFSMTLITLWCYRAYTYKSFKFTTPLWYDKETFKWCVITGVLNALNGFFVLYSSPSSRTPALLQSILGNLGIIFAIPANKWFMHDTKRYCSWRPMLAVGLILISTFIALIPTFQELTSGNADAMWPFIFVVGIAFAAFYSVTQSRALLYLKQNSVSYFNTIDHYLHILTWSCLFLLITVCLLFGVDFLPWFGSSSTMSDFTTNVNLGVGWSFNPSKNPTFVYGFLFNIGYIISFYSSMPLTAESAPYTNYINTAVPILASLFWWCVPSLNPSNNRTPFWSIFPSLLISTFGIIFLKRWENHQVYQMLYNT
jgi:hypothetical protein